MHSLKYVFVPMNLIYTMLETIPGVIYWQSTFSKQTGSILHKLWLHITGPICRLSRSGQLQPSMFPSPTPLTTCLLSLLPSFQGSASLVPVKKWPLRPATNLEAKTLCRDTWVLSCSCSQERSLAHSDFGYRIGRVGCYKMFCETQGTVWLCKFFPKPLQ